ncbi:MAG TPA: hypothetical protein VIK77_00270 [Tissierellaceae bacterium]
MKKPELINPFIKQIYKDLFPGSLQNFVNSFPTKYVKGENDFHEWMLSGQTDKNVPLMNAETLSGASLVAGTLPATIGGGGEQFYLYFSEPIFSVTELIKGESDNWFLLVKEGPDDVGSNMFRYKVELNSGSYQTAIDVASELQLNMRFARHSAVVPGEGSYQGFESWVSGHFTMRNRLQKIRAQGRVLGSMIRQGKNEPLEFPFQLSNGATATTWVNALELQAMHDMDLFIARQKLYGKRNWNESGQYLNFDDGNGRPIATMSGLFEQIAPGNRKYYNTFDLDLLVDMAEGMSIGKFDSNNRMFTIITGSEGAKAIHRAIDAKQNTKIALMEQGDFIKKVGMQGKTPQMGFGYQFTQFYTYLGIGLNVQVWDWLDDRTYFTKSDPDNPTKSLESSRMIVMPYGQASGVYNLALEGQPRIYNAINGMRSAYSPAGKTMAAPGTISNPFDGYEFHIMDNFGFMVEDPTVILDFKKNA